MVDYPTPKAPAQRPGFILVTDRVVEYVVVLRQMRAAGLKYCQKSNEERLPMK